MFNENKKLYLTVCAASPTLRILVDGKVHPLLVGFHSVREALDKAFKLYLGAKIHLSKHCYFVWKRGHKTYELVDEGRNDRPENATAQEMEQVFTLIRDISAATTNGSALGVAAAYRRDIRASLLPDFDPKCLDYGHKRIPGPLVPFFQKELYLLGDFDASHEVKAFGDERLLNQVIRLQKALAQLPESDNAKRLDTLAQRLVAAVSDLQDNGEHHWTEDHQKIESETTSDTMFGGLQLLTKARELQQQIEALPAGFHASHLSSRMAEVCFALQQLHGTGEHYWPNAGRNYDEQRKIEDEKKVNHDDFIRVTRDLDNAKRLIKDIHADHPLTRATIENRTGNWLALGCNRDTSEVASNSASFDAATQNQIAAIQVLHSAAKVAENIVATDANKSLVHPYPDNWPRPTTF